MADKIVTLARYSNVMEAQLARNRLEAEGIPVQLAGEGGGGVLPGMEFSFGNFQLLVAEADVERASAALGFEEEEPPEPEEGEEDEEDRPSTDIRAQAVGEIRPARDDEPPPGGAIRPRAPHDVPPAQASRSPDSLPPELVGSEEADLEEKVRQRFTWTPAEYASRAFRAAGAGLILFPLMAIFMWPVGPVGLLPNLYSAWLLVRIAVQREEVNDAGMRRVYAALAINAAVLVMAAVIYRPIIVLFLDTLRRSV